MTTHPCGGYPPPFRPTYTSTYPHHHPTTPPPRLSGSAKLLSPLPVSNCKRVAMSVLFPLHCSLSLAKFISHQERFYFCRGRSIAPTFPIYGRDLGSSGNPSGVGGGSPGDGRESQGLECVSWSRGKATHSIPTIEFPFRTALWDILLGNGSDTSDGITLFSSFCPSTATLAQTKV